MSTSWVNRWRHRGAQIGQKPIIAPQRWRTWLALGLVATLAACSTLRLSYNQGPTAAYWWADRYVDWSEGQSPQVKQDLQAFFAWHRREALPPIQQQLERWHGLLAQDISAEQVCREFDWVQAQLRLMGEQGAAPLARWASGLQPEQVQRMQKKFEERNQDFAEEHIEAPAAERFQERLKDNRQRWSDWYGRLSQGQLQALEQQLRASPWDAAITLEERRWRQADLLATVKRAQQSPEQAPAALRQHLLRYQTASTPQRETQRQQWLRSGCAQFAQMHQSMNSEQRAHAQARLRGYIDDVAALIAHNRP
jgi:nucleotide-binding universal stress UspA family protein